MGHLTELQVGLDLKDLSDSILELMEIFLLASLAQMQVPSVWRGAGCSLWGSVGAATAQSCAKECAEGKRHILRCLGLQS